MQKFSQAVSSFFPTFVNDESTGIAEFGSRSFPQRMAQVILVVLPLALLLGPRISIPLLSQGDFRFHEFILGLVITYFLITDVVARDRKIWDLATVGFWISVCAGVVVLAAAVVSSSVTIGTFYILRLLEPLVVAFAVFRLLEAGGLRALEFVLRSVFVGFLLNLTWVAFQIATRPQRALLELGIVDSRQYGVSLAGEAGAFSAGQTLVLLLAGAVSYHIVASKPLIWNQILSTLAIILAFFSLIAVGSRVSTLVGLCLIVLWVGGSAQKFGAFSRLFSHSIGIVLLGAVVLITFALPSRLRLGLITQAVSGELTDFRVSNIYLPILQLIEGSFVFGLGPGQLREETNAEAHSLFLAVLADFGLLGLAAFLLLTIAFLLFCLKLLKQSSVTTVRWLALWSLFATSNLFFSGIFQSSHMATLPMHLGAIVIAALLWVAGAAENPISSGVSRVFVGHKFLSKPPSV